MKKLFLFFLLTVGAYAQSDSCLLTATVADLNPSVAAVTTLYYRVVVRPGAVTTKIPLVFTVISSNTIRFKLPRKKTVYVHGWNIDGFNSGYEGRRSVIPDAATGNFDSTVNLNTTTTTTDQDNNRVIVIPTSGSGTGDTTGYFALYGGVMLEVDPLFTDSANQFDRAIIGGDSSARNTKLEKSFARSSTAFDTTLIGGRHNNFTIAQRFTQLYTPGQGLYPFIWTKLQDSVAARWGLSFGNYAWTNGPVGSTDYIDQVGGWQYNPNREDPTQPNFGFSQETKYYVSSAFHSEMHQVFNGVGGQLGVRPYTWIGRWGDGRVTSTSINADRIDLGNGGGSNSGDVDSTALTVVAAGMGATGTVTLNNYAILRAAKANAAILSAFDGTSYKTLLGTAGNTIYDIGGSGWTQGRITAGTKTFTAYGANGFFYLPNGSWSGTASDSLISASKGYVDTRIAGLSFLTPAQLSDTLNAGSVRPGVLAAYATLAAMRAEIKDSANALITAGPRGISSTARIFVADDSITFVGEAGDVINASTGNVFRGTIGANDTLSVSNMVDGQVITIIITNASTYTLGWTGVNWAGGAAPTLSATANKRDAFTIIRAGGIMYGSFVQDLR